MFFGAVLFWGAFCLMRPSNMSQRKCQMLRGTCAETRRRRSCPTNFCWQPSSCSSSLWRNHPRDLHLTCWIYARVFQQPSRRSHSFGPKKTRRNWKAAWEHTWHHLTSPDIASIPKSWGFTVLPRVSFQITQQSCKMFFNVFHTIRYLITCVGCQTMWGTSALTVSTLFSLRWWYFFVKVVKDTNVHEIQWAEPIIYILYTYVCSSLSVLWPLTTFLLGTKLMFAHSA